jgi:hypothetical protein
VVLQAGEWQVQAPVQGKVIAPIEGAPRVVLVWRVEPDDPAHDGTMKEGEGHLVEEWPARGPATVHIGIQ